MLKKSLSVGLIAASAFSAGALANSVMFKDVPAGSWFESSANWAAEKGLMKGRSEGMFAPDGNVSRAELATVMQRYDMYMEKKMKEMMGEEKKDEVVIDEEKEPTTKGQAFEVTVENTSSDQILSPGFYVVHTDNASINYLDELSPKEMEALAEVGDPSEMVAMLKGAEDVIGVYTVDAPITAGEMMSFMVEVPDGTTSVYLSGIQMIVGSNDGYAQVNKVNLFDDKGVAIENSATANNFDNGTEENEELNGGFEKGQPDPTKGEANIDNGTATEPQAKVMAHPQLTSPVMEVRVAVVM